MKNEPFSTLDDTLRRDRIDRLLSAAAVVLVIVILGVLLWAVMASESKAGEPVPDDGGRFAPYREALVQTGLRFPGAMIFRSEPDPRLAAFAQAQAVYQARVKRQGHQLWEYRAHAIQAAMEGRVPTEICAESWSWERDATPLMIGESMFRAWRNSPGHWGVCKKQHRYYGAGIALGANGIWYATVIVVD